MSISKKQLYVFCDGGARGNPGPAAIGFILKDSRGKTLAQQGRYIGRATNNVAEYTAVIDAFRWIINNFSSFQFSVSSFQFFLDSKLIVCQLNGLYKIKNKNLQNLVITIKKLETKLSVPVIYHHISREKNYLADRLVNDVLSNI